MRMKSKITECLELFKKDISDLKNKEGPFNLGTERLEQISLHQYNGINCVTRNLDLKLEADKIEQLKLELNDLKFMLKSARIIEQAFLEKIPESEIGSADILRKRQRAKDRNRVVISKLQEQIFEVSYEIHELTRYRDKIVYSLIGMVFIVIIELVGFFFSRII